MPSKLFTLFALALPVLGIDLPAEPPPGYDANYDYLFQCPLAVADPSLFGDDGLCNPICVANASTDCPPGLEAPAGMVVCPDGLAYPQPDPTIDVCTLNYTVTDFCADNTACGLVQACGRDPNITNCSLYPDLMVVNSGCYDYESTDGEAFDYNYAPGYYVPAIWICLLSFAAIMFTVGNQAGWPVGKSAIVKTDVPLMAQEETKDMELVTFSDHATQDPDFDSHGSIVQTGFTFSIAGWLLWVSLLVTAVGFQLILILLTVNYYNQDIPGSWVFVPNYTQGLAWFIHTWHVASIFMIAVMHPTNLRAMFYRRCELKNAQYVEVWHRTQDAVIRDVGGKYIQVVYTYFDYVFRGYMWFMNTCVCYQPRRITGQTLFCPVTSTSGGRRVFTYQLRQFVLDEDKNAFLPAVISLPHTCDALLALKQGLTADEAQKRLDLVGQNVIAVPPPSLWKELVKEFSRGFYIYQTFMAWTWFNFAYWHMGILLMCVFTLGGVSIMWVNYNNAKILATLIGSPSQVTVIRSGERKSVLSIELVPGDVCEIDPGLNTCDMVLISGKVVLDESSLTGESMPVAKDPIEARPERFTTNSQKKSVILAGTSTMQGDKQEEAPLGLVLATGGSSEKGVQIRDILFRATPLFKFNYQVRIVVFLMGLLAVFGGILTASFLGNKNQAEAWFYSMYVVASALPPLLPTVFVVSVGLSSNRLLAKRVVCSEPPRLLMAGKVRVCCFDKTGTLTKQGMDFYGVRTVSKGQLGEHTAAVSGKDKSPEITLMQRAMVTCQALSKTSTGMLIGTAVDLKMFEACGWDLESKDDVDANGSKVRRDMVTRGEEKLAIVWRFDFDRHRMTMGVVVRDGAKHFVVFKGSAEAVGGICSQVPPNYLQMGEDYASQGCYTLGVCSRECTPEEEQLIASNGVLDRNMLEQKLTCLGFLTFKNEVKPDSAEALRLLRGGAVRTLMITGDHPLTAVKIATELALLEPNLAVIRATRMKADAPDSVEWVDQEGKLVDLPEDLTSVELVINGVVFRAIKHTSTMQRLLTHIRVFARMSPDDKVAVVNLYIYAGFVTAMCGDGGNDCGALRAAHVGVALSDAEASVVSPFTGVSKSAMSVVDVLLEGRCGLACAFACYKNVVLYGLIETLNQILNAYYAITFPEWNWVMLDGAWIMTTSFALATAKPNLTLSDRRPTGSPLDVITSASCIGVMVIHVIYLSIAMNVLGAQDWYQCRRWDVLNADIGDLAGIGDNYESSVIWLVTGAQLLHSAAAFNFGGKHRSMWIRNWKLALTLAFFYTLHAVVIMYPSKVSGFYRINCDNWNTSPSVLSLYSPHPIENPWGTTVMPYAFRGKILAIVIFNLISVCLWEYVVVFGVVGEQFRKWKPRTKHLRL